MAAMASKRLFASWVQPIGRRIDHRMKAMGVGSPACAASLSRANPHYTEFATTPHAPLSTIDLVALGIRMVISS